MLAAGVMILGESVMLAAHAASLLEPFTIIENGGWCWFQDERAIIFDGKIIAGGVAGEDRAGMSGGDIVAVIFDPVTGRRTTTMLHEKLDRDDHAAPSFIEDMSGGVIAAYSTHGRDKFTRWRRLTENGVSPETVFASLTRTTYTNLLRTCVGEACRLWNFIRSEGGDPNFLVSDDDGTSWRYGGRLLKGPGTPYVKYASDGEKIHFAASDQHPRVFGTSLYYGTISARDGSPATKPTNLEPVFAGDDGHRAWPIDIEVGDDGEPRILFSVQMKGWFPFEYFWPGQDNRYFLGSRQKDGRWSVSQIAYAGVSLYPAESEYTGLGAIDPNVKNRIVISANVHPTTAFGLPHYELFEGTPVDGGWGWKSLTTESKADNLRPIIPSGEINGQSILLWERGKLRTYTNYSTEIVGLLLR